MTPKKLSTCPCGSADFKESQVILQLHTGATHAETVQGQDFWMRSCNACGQVTLWNQKAQR
jgi:predicted nucleic-acid-binding Zn-ribbon protein